MMRIIGFLMAVAALVSAGPARAEFVTGLTSANSLVTFDSAAPQVITNSVAITGASGLLSLDYRPTTGVLYGVSRDTLYTINAATGQATTVASLSGLSTSPLVRYSVDFNPQADVSGNNSLRVIGSNGDNFRVNVATGGVTTDGSVNPTGFSLRAVAYSGNDTDPATGTALYGIGSNNSLYVSTPPAGPNAGTFSLVGSTGLSAVFSPGGFDVSVSGVAYAAFGSGAGSQFYTIDLATGAATLVGQRVGSTSGGATVTLLDISVGPQPVAAVPLPPTVLAALGLPLLALARRRLV